MLSKLSKPKTFNQIGIKENLKSAEDKYIYFFLNCESVTGKQAPHYEMIHFQVVLLPQAVRDSISNCFKFLRINFLMHKIFHQKKCLSFSL